MLSSAHDWRKRSTRPLECSGPCPRSRAATSSTMPLGRCHLDSDDTMNWSMIVCAPFTKSPNCASHMHSMLGIIERVPVVEPEHRRLAQRRVVNAKTRLPLGEVVERDITLARLSHVVEHAQALRERPAPAVLAAQAHRFAVEQQRAERQRLRERPVVRPARLEHLQAAVEQVLALELGEDVNVVLGRRASWRAPPFPGTSA